MERFLAAVMLAILLRSIDGQLAPTNNAKLVDNGNDIQLSQQSQVNTELVSSDMDVILNSLNQPHISERFQQLKTKRRKFMKRSLIRLNKILKETPVSPIIGQIIFMLDDNATSSGGNGNSDTEGTENMEIETRGLIGEMPSAQTARMSEGPKDPEMSFDADLPPIPVKTTMPV